MEYYTIHISQSLLKRLSNSLLDLSHLAIINPLIFNMRLLILLKGFPSLLSTTVCHHNGRRCLLTVLLLCLLGRLRLSDSGSQNGRRLMDLRLLLKSLITMNIFLEINSLLLKLRALLLYNFTFFLPSIHLLGRIAHVQYVTPNKNN